MEEGPKELEASFEWPKPPPELNLADEANKAPPLPVNAEPILLATNEELIAPIASGRLAPSAAEPSTIGNPKQTSQKVPIGARHGPLVHNWKRLFLIILQFIVLLVTLFFNYLAVRNDLFAVVSMQIYESNTGEISDRYKLMITPAGWTFSIWGAIYIWQLLHTAYSLSLIVRRSGDGNSYMYIQPAPIHCSFYIMFTLNNLANIAWLQVFDKELMEVALGLIYFMAVTLWLCGISLCISLNKAGPCLESSGRRKDIWFTRLLALNGIAFYGTWIMTASLLNLCIVLEYTVGVEPEVSTFIALGILAGELLLWFVLETFVFDRFLRYCFSPYLLLPVALSGIMYEHFTATNIPPYIMFVIGLLALTGLLGIAKFVIMFRRAYKKPIIYTPPIQSKEAQ